MTPSRMDVLKRCAAATIGFNAQGFQPLGPDWFAIYWLRDNGYVEKAPGRPHCLTPRFTVTAAGRYILSNEHQEAQ